MSKYNGLPKKVDWLQIPILWGELNKTDRREEWLRQRNCLVALSRVLACAKCPLAKFPFKRLWLNVSPRAQHTLVAKSPPPRVLVSLWPVRKGNRIKIRPVTSSTDNNNNNVIAGETRRRNLSSMCNTSTSPHTELNSRIKLTLSWIGGGFHKGKVATREIIKLEDKSADGFSFAGKSSLLCSTNLQQPIQRRN